jgi:hypothetical protein
MRCRISGLHRSGDYLVLLARQETPRNGFPKFLLKSSYVAEHFG